MRKRALVSALLAWLAAAGFGVLYRGFERSVLAPDLGSEAAAFHGTTALAGAILLAALLLIGTAPFEFTRRELWTIGAAWAFFTALVECARAGSWESLVADFDPARGGLFALVLLTALAAPPLFGSLRTKSTRPI